MTNNSIYQEMTEKQRVRHRKTGGGWPGKPAGAPASSKYPNLLAELSASGRWLDSLSNCVEVAPAIIAAVMEDGNELTIGEMGRASRYFGCGMNYLAAPVLSMVDSVTGKGKCRIQRLKELERRTEGMDGTFRFLYDLHCKKVLSDLESGKPVTYAAYRWACYHLTQELDMKAMEEAKQQRTRTEQLQREPMGVSSEARIRMAKERNRVKQLASRLFELKKYADSVTVSATATTYDLLSLMEFSKEDLSGSLILAMSYGQAIGYRAAKAEG